MLAAAAAAAKEHLHEGAYDAAEIESIIGLPLDELYADNQHSQRCGRLACRTARVREQ